MGNKFKSFLSSPLIILFFLTLLVVLFASLAHSEENCCEDFPPQKVWILVVGVDGKYYRMLMNKGFFREDFRGILWDYLDKEKKDDALDSKRRGSSQERP